MKRLTFPRCLLLIVALVGLLCALPQLRARGEIEATQKQVELTMSYQDVMRLAAAAQQPIQTWLEGLHDAGLYRVYLTDEEMERPEVVSAVTSAGLKTAQIGGVPQGGRYLFAAVYDMKAKPGRHPGLFYEPETLKETTVMTALRETDSTLILVENEPQTGVILPPDWTLEAWDGYAVKATWLTPYLQSRYRVLGYNGAQEIVNICFRSVVDRGMTSLWLSPFRLDHRVIVNDLMVYQDAFRQLEQRLTPSGYTYDEAAPIPLLTLPRVSLFLLGVGVFALSVYLVSAGFPVKRTWVLVALFLLGTAESAAGTLIVPELQRVGISLLAALVFPAASVLLLGWSLQRQTKRNRRFPVFQYLGTTALTAAVAVAGGLYVGAVLGTSDYMMILRLFRGVKLSQMALYLFAMVWLAVALLHVPGNGPLADCRALLAEYSGHKKLKLLLLVLFFVAVCAVYILRSGDGMVSVSGLELRARNWLETGLLFRPRTKEFLIGWPALALACLCAARGKKLLSWIFGVLSAIGCASVVNTFCHIRAHLTVSLGRTGIGILLGVVLGMVLLLILGALWRGQPRNDETESPAPPMADVCQADR